MSGSPMTLLMRQARRFLILCLAWILNACDHHPRQGTLEDVQAMVLVSVDTLIETEALFVGRPRRAVFTPERRLLISDQFARRVVEFDADGSARRTIGRPGSGPGEFSGPVAVALWGKDTLAVSDASTQSVSLFRLGSGEFVTRIQSTGVPTSLAAPGRYLFLAAYSLGTNAAAGVIAAGDSAPRFLLPFPEDITANPLAMRAYPASFISARTDSVAVVFIASNRLYVAGSNGDAVKSFAIPNGARRPIPTPLDPALQAVVNTPERMTFIPSLDGVHWRPDGLIVVWYKDWYAPEGGFKNPAGAVSEATLRIFATVVDRDRSRACVDLAIPSEWAENPALFADGLSIYALGHTMDGRSGRPTLELRRFDFPLDSCNWTPLPG